MRTANQFHQKCRAILAKAWEEAEAIEDTAVDILPAWSERIHLILTAPRGVSSSFRFVPITQLVAKIADRGLDCRSLQLREGTGGTFNARDVAKNVVVPFNRDHGYPLGNASDPYVNNPLRVPSLTAEYRPQQSDPERWDMLCEMMESAEASSRSDYVPRLLRQVLLEFRRRIDAVAVTYTPPAKIGHDILVQHVEEYLAPRTGGRRFQAVSTALFKAMGAHWGIFDEVISGAATAPDAPGRRAADIECVKDGEIVLAVEAKNMTLTLELLQDKIISTRAAEVTELIFLIRANPIVESEEVRLRAEREFASGQNIYLTDASTFMGSAFMLMGEDGRRIFVEALGQVLDDYGLDFTDRHAWADILNHW